MSSSILDSLELDFASNIRKELAFKKTTKSSFEDGRGALNLALLKLQVIAYLNVMLFVYTRGSSLSIPSADH